MIINSTAGLVNKFISSWYQLMLPRQFLTPLVPGKTITPVYKSWNVIGDKNLIKLSLISTVEALVLMRWVSCKLYHKWRLLFEIPLRKDQRTPVNIFLLVQKLKISQEKGLHLRLHHHIMMVAGRQHWVWVCCREREKKKNRPLYVLYKIGRLYQ